MNLDEIFLVTFTLKANNLDYDDFKSPKTEMGKILIENGINKYLDSVYDQIIDIPSKQMKEQIISFLFKNFIINCEDNEKKMFYLNMDKNNINTNFYNNRNFAKLLITNYYLSVIKDVKNLNNSNNIENTSNYNIISLNNKLKQSFTSIIDDFISKATDIYLTYDVLKHVIFDNRPIKNEKELDCYEDLEFLRTYRTYFIKIMTYEIYEDIMFTKSDVSRLYNDSLWTDNDEDDDLDFFDDPGYLVDDKELFFEDIITSIIEDNAVYKNLPSEFYEDFLCIYQELIETPEKQRTNREYMKRNHQKVLKRSNPLYAFDEI